MKIIFALDGLLTGGAEKSTLDIISRLPAHIKPLVVVFYRHYDLKLEFERAGIELVCFDLKGKYEFKQAIRKFSELCSFVKPDLVVGTLFRAEVISRIVCKRMGIPNIGTFVSDTYSSYALEDLPPLMKAKIWSLWILNKITANYCVHFIANSNSIKESNSKKLLIDKSKIDVVYRGRNIANFNFSVDSRLVSERVKFLNVGRLLKSKGQKELIIAFASFIQKYPNATLEIAGEGKYRSVLESTIREYRLEDKVSLLGSVKNVPELLDKCDVFVFPSHYEGFSGAIVEAMLAGAPVLASDIPMNKEAIEHSETGYLFKVKDSSSIEAAMFFALSNKNKMRQMAIKARYIAIEKYDIDSIASQHAVLYQKYSL